MDDAANQISNNRTSGKRPQNIIFRIRVKTNSSYISLKAHPIELPKRLGATYLNAIRLVHLTNVLNLVAHQIESGLSPLCVGRG